MTRHTNLRIVLFTVLPEFIPSAEEFYAERGHRLVGIVSAPGPRTRRTDGYRAMSQFARPGLDVIVSNAPARWADMIRPLQPDLIACAAFNWKIPADVLAVPRLGAYNGHDALLPKYRGRNATGWALRNDEPEYGATIHHMTPEFDDGPILAQVRIPITDDDDIDTLFPKFVAAVDVAHAEALDAIERGETGTPQDESMATYTGGAFEPEWRYIDWTMPARKIFLQVRSWYGRRDVPRGAFGLIGGQQALITKTHLTGITSNLAAPGTVLERRTDGTLQIQCGDGPLDIVAWEMVASDAEPTLVETYIPGMLEISPSHAGTTSSNGPG